MAVGRAFNLRVAWAKAVCVHRGECGPSKEMPSGPSKHAATKDRGQSRVSRRRKALKLRIATMALSCGRQVKLRLAVRPMLLQTVKEILP